MAQPMQDLVGEAAHDAGLPPRPDPSARPFLDAAARCIERYGWERTSVRDIAREAGVERTTVYRNVGSMEQILRLLVAREVHRLIEAVPTALPPGVTGPEMVVEVVATAVEHTLAHPLLAKALTDEPEVIGRFLAGGLPDLVTRVVTTLSPVVAQAMDLGQIARRDPVIVTEWLVRTTLTLVVAPPPGDLRSFLREVVEPLLSVP